VLFTAELQSVIGDPRPGPTSARIVNCCPGRPDDDPPDTSKASSSRYRVRDSWVRGVPGAAAGRAEPGLHRRPACHARSRGPCGVGRGPRAGALPRLPFNPGGAMSVVVPGRLKPTIRFSSSEQAARGRTCRTAGSRSSGPLHCGWRSARAPLVPQDPVPDGTSVAASSHPRTCPQLGRDAPSAA
jgi:hypothetical protein